MSHSAESTRMVSGTWCSISLLLAKIGKMIIIAPTSKCIVNMKGFRATSGT